MKGCSSCSALGAAVAAPSSPVHTDRELDAVLSALCAVDATYPARTACVVRAVTGYAGQIDAVAAQAMATGASLGRSLTPVTSKDPAVKAAQEALRKSESEIARAMIGVAPQLTSAARDLRQMGRTVAETMTGATETFNRLAQTWDETDDAGRAELEPLMQQGRDWIKDYYQDQVRRVFDLGLFFAEIAAKLQNASAVLVDYRFADLAERQRLLQRALDGWRKTLDNWQQTLNVMNPIAAIGRGVLALPGEIGKAAGEAAGGFLGKVWPYAVGGVVLVTVLRAWAEGHVTERQIRARKAA